MIEQQKIIKDKEKLFNKLFISPTFCQNVDPPLLVSPDFISLLLQQSLGCSRVYQKQLIDDILKVFVQRPTNSLLLSLYDEQKIEEDKCILNTIIYRILMLVNNQQEIQLYIQKVILMLSYYRITLRNFRKILQFISKNSYVEKFCSIKLMFVLKLIKIYYSRKLGQHKSPPSYFYLFGSENSGIQPVQHSIDQFSFKNELTVILSFNSQGENQYQSKPYNLFLLKTQKKQQLGLTYNKGVLKLTALNNSQFIHEFIVIKQLSEQVWYRIVINFSTYETQCIINNQIYRNKSLIRRQRQRKITGCVFGRQFFGMLTSILISNKNIPFQKFDTNSYPYGISSISDLKSLNKTNIPDSIIISCLPFFTFEVRQTMHCFDCFKRNHSSIAENISILNQPISSQDLSHLGGCCLLLPLFYLARFYDRNQYPGLLQDLFEILLQILNTYSVEKLEMQFQQTNFIQILGQHMSDISYLQTQKSIKMIFKIYKKLKNQKLKITYIRDVIWCLNVGIQVTNSPSKSVMKSVYQHEYQPFRSFKCQQSSPTKIFKDQMQQLINAFYQNIKDIYQQQPILAFKSMSLTQIIYWAVLHLQANQNLAFSCCLQHHLNESILSEDVSINQLIKLQSSHNHFHYLHIQEILKLYLQNILKKLQPFQKTDELQSLKILLRLFLQKYSACFYLCILKVFKHLINNVESVKKQINKLLVNPSLQIVSFMMFLSEKTINPDIIAEILYISFCIDRCMKNARKQPQQDIQTNKKQDATRFIINLLKINQKLQMKNMNPIQVLVKSIRKYSCNIQSSNTDRKSLDQKTNMRSQQSQQQTIMNQQKNQRIKIAKSMINKLSNNKQSIQISEHRLSRIIARSPKPQRISRYRRIFNVIMNYLGGVVSESEPATQYTNFTAQSISIMKQYYKLAQPQYKQSILLLILSSLQKNPKLKQNQSLNIFLLQCLKQSVFDSAQQTKNLLTIFTCMLSQIINDHGDTSIFYSSIKFLKYSKSSITVILPLILTKVIKLADFQQMIYLAMICLYENIQSSGQSSFQLGRIVIQSLHQVIKNSSSSYIFNVFNKSVCTHKDKSAFSNINDPFQKLKQKQSQSKAHNMKENNGLNGQNTTNQFQLSQMVQNNANSDNKFTKNQIMKDKQNQFQMIGQDQKEQLKYFQTLTAFEIYLKLFFKVYQKLCSQNQQTSQIRSSIKRFQNSSLIKKSKSAQIFYSYQFTTKQILAQQFSKIASTYLSELLNQKQNEPSQKFYKFIFSFILYKIVEIGNKFENIQLCASQIIQLVFNNVVKQNTQPLKVQQNHQQIKVKNIFLSFMCKGPFQLKITDFFMWKEDRSLINVCFKNHYINQVLVEQTQYSTFFKQIQDVHQMMIVSYYQKNMQPYVFQYENIMTNSSTQKCFRNIQKLFDIQNSAQQKTRIAFLYQNECRFRKYHFQWDQLWNKLRIYHQPYGFWMAQKCKDSIYTYPQNSIRNFKFEVSQFPTETGFYPILEPKIIQPWTTIKDNKVKKNKYINSFSEMMKPSHIKSQKLQNQNNIFANVWRGMLGLSKKKSADVSKHIKFQQYDVVLINRSTKAIGKLFIQNKLDLIFCYQGAKQQDNHLSFQKFSLAFNRQTYQKWYIFTMQKIKTHRYLMKYQSLQIMFIDGRSVIFEFIYNDKNAFIKQLQKIQKQKMQSINNKLYKINKIPFFDQGFFQINPFDSKITQKWQKRQISNLEYLIRLNRSASRGIYDLSQYMVVPWVVEFKKEKQPKFRDLSKTMGGLGSEQRKRIVSQKYFAKDPFNPYPPFFFGTHYSSPGVVFNLLIRLSPFTQYCKHLQGGKFDIPDRLFSTLVGAWRSASEQVSDVRQLIPQIYYLPQTLINIDENNFGYTQNKQLISHVQIPPWGANNPYYFTSQLRQIMQSQEVSQKLNQWIDLIFGYKQKGKEAEQNFNVYYYLTYQDYINNQQDQDDIYKKSKQAQIVHFGQIPPMMFDKPHPKRNKNHENSLYQIYVARTVQLMNSLKQKPIGLKISNNQLTICKRNQYQIYSAQSNPATLQLKKKFNFQKSATETYYVIKKQKSHVVFLQKPYFLIWGYLSNQIRIFNKNSGKLDEQDYLPSSITALHVNKAQDLILIGLLSGILVIYQIQYGINDIFIKKIGSQCFPSSVTHISQFDGFFTITFGAFCSIYKIHRSLHYLMNSSNSQIRNKNATHTYNAFIKLFRSFSNNLPLKFSFMVGSPLYAMILIDNANIKSYSINGQFIKSICNTAKFYSRFKDCHLHDILYAVDEDRVIAFSTPDLRNVSIMDVPNNCQYVYQNYLIGKQIIMEVGYGSTE